MRGRNLYIISRPLYQKLYFIQRGVEMCRENRVENLGIIAVLRTYVRCATIYTSKLTEVSVQGGQSR